MAYFKVALAAVCLILTVVTSHPYQYAQPGINYLGLGFPFAPWAYPPVVTPETHYYQAIENLQKTVQDILNVQKYLIAALLCEDRKKCSSLVELEKIYNNTLIGTQQPVAGGGQLQGTTITSTTQNGQGAVLVTEFHTNPELVH